MASQVYLHSVYDSAADKKQLYQKGVFAEMYGFVFS